MHRVALKAAKLLSTKCNSLKQFMFYIIILIVAKFMLVRVDINLLFCVMDAIEHGANSVLSD